MKDFKRSNAVILTLSFCAVLVVGLAFLYLKNKNISFNSSLKLKTDQFVQDKEALNRLLQNSSEIHRIWNEGEDSREWNRLKQACLKHYKITSTFDESLLRCNPILLQCNSLLNSKLNYRFVKPDSNDKKSEKLYRYITKSNTAHQGLKSSGYLFTIEDNLSHQRLNLLLTDQCQEVFLQKRIYAYGEEVLGKPSEDIEDYRFENFNQNIYIDRHLVTNFEINEWIDFGNPNFTKGIRKKETDDLFMPAIELSYVQMENYCSFKGKQIMLAHYFDAATFLPMDLSDLKPKKNNRGPFYWGKKKSDFKEECDLLYAEECLRKKAFKLNFTGPSWAGIMDPMGGVLEAFRNPIDPESNLKASSYYFSFKSSWHQLGFRAKWDGEGFDLRHFDFKGLNPMQSIDKFQVGFRCMREAI